MPELSAQGALHNRQGTPSNDGSMKTLSMPCNAGLIACRCHAPTPPNVEHVFGTLKAWMGSAHFRMRTMKKVATEMSLHVLAYNLKRVIAIMGAEVLTAAIRAV